MENIDTSSRHKINDIVILDFYNCGKLLSGTISGVTYTDNGKVLYDVTLYPFAHEENNKHLKTVLKNIDSYFVKKESDNIIPDLKINNN